jgi:hypothetical protein
MFRTNNTDFYIPAESVEAALAALKAFEPGEFDSWYWKEAGFEARLQAAETVEEFLRLLGWAAATQDETGAIYEVEFAPGPDDDKHFQSETQNAFERVAPYVSGGSYIEYEIYPSWDDAEDEEVEDSDYFRWLFDGTTLIEQTGETSIVYK